MDALFAHFTALAIVGGAIAVVVSVVVGRKRRLQDLRPFLEPPLRSCGVEYLSAVGPPLFHTGPFPIVEFERGRPQSSALGVSGEYLEYKIVTIRDKSGRTHQLWAIVEFELFRFRRVRWRAQSSETLPKSVLPLLEN